MPPKKKKLKYMGLYYPLRFHPDVKRFSSKRTALFNNEKNFDGLIKAASEPFLFLPECRENKFIESFARIYARHPDDALALISLIRKILKQWSKTQFGIVLQFLHNTPKELCVEHRRQEFDKSGDCIAVIARSNLDGTEKRIPVSGLSPREILEMLLPRFVETSSLLDKDLATILKVNVASVKKARQEAVRIDEEIANFYRGSRSFLDSH